MSGVEVNPFAGESIFAEYAPDDSFYDEIFCGKGEVRPGWSDFLSTITGIGRTELMSRWLQAQEEIHETGIAYNIYDQSDGAVRPWELDLLPQLIAPAEWSVLSAGLSAAGQFAQSPSRGFVWAARITDSGAVAGGVAICPSWLSPRLSWTHATEWYVSPFLCRRPGAGP